RPEVRTARIRCAGALRRARCAAVSERDDVAPGRRRHLESVRGAQSSTPRASNQSLDVDGDREARRYDMPARVVLPSLARTDARKLHCDPPLRSRRVSKATFGRAGPNAPLEPRGALRGRERKANRTATDVEGTGAAALRH